METQTNPDSHLLEAYAELKQRCVDLEKMNAHLSFKFNQAKDPEFDAQKKIIRLESELKESKEIIAKLKELRRADGLEMNHYRNQVNKLTEMIQGIIDGKSPTKITVEYGSSESDSE